MIGIVIVSHSRKLSDGLKEVAEAMSQAPVPIASAGGIDDPEDPLGTDATLVLTAIRDVMEDDVLIFADIGSARLSAETALDLLEPDERKRAHFCDAPLVEGVLAAAVQIAAGGDLAAVTREARAAGQTSTGQDARAMSGGVTRDFLIRNRLGLHARPAALFVKAMSAFVGDIRLINLTKGKPPANAKSINAVMLSEVSGNDTVTLVAAPDEAEAVFGAMAALVEANFDEEDLAPPAPPTSAKEPAKSTETTDGVLAGVSISKGYAIGPLRHVTRELPEIDTKPASDIPAEISRLETALQEAEDQIRKLLDEASPAFGSNDRKIFDAHIELLRDPEIRQRVTDLIETRRVCAESAWRDVIVALSATYAALDDPVLRARKDDVVDVGLRVLQLLMDANSIDDSDAEPAILSFDDLRPSDVLALNLNKVLGVCSASGGRTSHAGILASALPIPVIFAVGEDLLNLPEGTVVMIDGATAKMTVAPTPEDVFMAEANRDAWIERRNKAEAVKHLPARTKDGHTVRVAANIASAEEVALIAGSGAEEIGLFRTEFLFMRRSAPPDEDEQYGIYRKMVEGLGGLPLTARTMDIGGDKPVTYMDRPAEANPNLGWRGLRYSLDEPDLFDTQLAALLRASAHGPVRIMFPLVSSLEEIQAAKTRTGEVKAALDRRGISYDPATEVGIMVEVPAAAQMADALASEVDFFSIGTNDLTQYVMAADRANPKLQRLSDPFHPAVLRMIGMTIRAAREARIWTGMCGAMAGNPLAAPILIGLGLDEFSMPIGDIPEFKLTVRGMDRTDCEALAHEVMELATAGDVKARVRRFLEPHSAEE